MPSANSLLELRELLTGRFPHAHSASSLPTASAIPTGVPALDILLAGGLPRGELTELVGPGAGSGSGLAMHELLRETAARGQFLALVDGADSFDVTAVEPAVLAHLLWVRCANAGEALKAADLLLRDPNVPLVALDLKLNSVAELRKISSSVWHRFRRLLEQNQTAMVVITPAALISGASWRVQCESNLDIEALSSVHNELLPQLRFTLLRAAGSSYESQAAQAG